jgi:hypothetical protein
MSIIQRAFAYVASEVVAWGMKHVAPTAEVVGDFRRWIRKVHRAQVRANHTSLSVETLTPDAVIVLTNLYPEINL